MKNLEETLGKTKEEIAEMPCWMVSDLICRAKHTEEVEWVDESEWNLTPFISIEQWMGAVNYDEAKHWSEKEAYVHGFVAVDAPAGGLPDIYIFNGSAPVWVCSATEEMMKTGYVGDDFMNDIVVQEIIEMNGIEEQIERETNEFGTHLNGKWW